MRHTIPYTKYYRLKSSVRATTVYADLGLQIVAVTVSQAERAAAGRRGGPDHSFTGTDERRYRARAGREVQTVTHRRERTVPRVPTPAYRTVGHDVRLRDDAHASLPSTAFERAREAESLFAAEFHPSLTRVSPGCLRLLGLWLRRFLFNLGCTARRTTRRAARRATRRRRS